MDLVEILENKSEAILDETMDAINHAHLRHYESGGGDETRGWLEGFYELTVESIRTKNVTPMVEYAGKMARERFSSGFDLFEVQSAINMLEEAIWTRVFNDMKPIHYSEALGLVSTVLGMAKDALARAYVSLASRKKAPSLDLRALFKGTDGS